MKENTNSKKALFNIIAPIYGIFYKGQVKRYENALTKIQKQVDLFKYKSILDIGCGTGAFCAAINNMNPDLKVTGIDAALEMIKQAKKRNVKNRVDFLYGSIINGLDFEDNSFDVVFSCYVVHGLKYEQRQKLYKEAVRLAKDKVIFYEYNSNRRFLTDIVEWAEGGDYFNFIKNAEKEMREVFKNVEITQVSHTATWYVCSV